MVAHTHGQLLNKTIFAKALELNSITISKYLNYFNSSYLIRILLPFHIHVKKRLSKSPKIYFRDSGILHHLLNIQDYNSLLGHPIVGHSWEGYIIEQITSVLGDRYDYFFYRTQDGTECDLVITDKLTPVAFVEVKFSSTPKRTKSLTIALKDIGAPQNYIVIPDCDAAYPLDENLTVCNPVQFFDLFDK